MTTKEKLQNYIDEASSFFGKNYTSKSSEFISWNNALIRFCEKRYGEKSSTTEMFKKRYYSLTAFFGNTPECEFVKKFENELKLTIADLNRLVDEEEEEIENLDKKNISNVESETPTININNFNTNTNNNSNLNVINILSYDEVQEKIENMNYDENFKYELIKKLDEIKNMEKSKLPQKDKWDIGKKILTFILDKGADIAIMYIPLLYNAIFR